MELLDTSYRPIQLRYDWWKNLCLWMNKWGTHSKKPTGMRHDGLFQRRRDLLKKLNLKMWVCMSVHAWVRVCHRPTERRIITITSSGLTHTRAKLLSHSSQSVQGGKTVWKQRRHYPLHLCLAVDPFPIWACCVWQACCVWCMCGTSTQWPSDWEWVWIITTS